MKQLTINTSTKLGPHRELGERFLEAMRFANLHTLSYRELAKQLEVTAPVIGRILHGHQNMRAATISRVCSLTGVDYNWLATGEGTMAIALAEMTIDLSDLTPSQQRNVQALVRSMKNENKKGNQP